MAVVDDPADLTFDEFVLAASTDDLGEESGARSVADAVEFRMDLADGDPVEALRAYDGALPVIATNRVRAEGGEAPAGPERTDALIEAVGCDGVAAVDVELSAVQAGGGRHVLNEAADADVTTIVSVHDFERTPAAERMRDHLESAAEVGDVAKLAVTAEGAGDVLDLLTVTHDLTRARESVATMAMGEAGRHSRAVAPLYGSRIGYAPVDPDDATAPGQYDLETLAHLVDSLREQ
ncbi:MAG: type I 3-dehydroquinate dehydratase [Halobacteriaceae archaeon]